MARTVLVCEGDRRVAAKLRRLLEADGFVVHLVTTSVEYQPPQFPGQIAMAIEPPKIDERRRKLCKTAARRLQERFPGVHLRYTTALRFVDGSFATAQDLASSLGRPFLEVLVDEASKLVDTGSSR